jgi:tetratricopeptide (TPR) repeat protein
VHSVFRIDQVKQIDGNDPQLHTLTQFMREETRGFTGWDRLGHLLNILGHFNKAEEVYEALLLQTTNDREKKHSYYMFGLIKENQEKYEEAVVFYEKFVVIKQKTLSPTHTDMATS